MRQQPSLAARPLVSPRFGKGFLGVPTPKPLVSGNWQLGSQYTCPAGKKAFVGFVSVFNPQASAITVNGYIGSAVATNQFASNVSVAAGAQLQPHQAFVLNAGDIYNMTASAQCNGFARVWEFPANEPFVGVKTASVNGTANVYTCPANKTAYMLGALYDCYGGFGCNTTAGAITMWTTFTPSGGSAQRMSSQQSLAAATSFYFPFAFQTPCFSAGDSLGFAATATGVNLWTAFVEMEL